MASEVDLVEALKAALFPTPVHWGWAPLESVAEPPALPLVVVQRQLFTTVDYEDMCEAPYVGDTTVVVDCWTLGYEQGRALATAVREATATLGEWRLQSETDQYEPNVRAWRIQGQWLRGGQPPL